MAQRNEPSAVPEQSTHEIGTPLMVEQCAAESSDTIAVRRSALARLHRHISDAHERSPTRKLRQAILIAEHMLNGDA
jgi:hypothetical protein